MNKWGCPYSQLIIIIIASESVMLTNCWHKEELQKYCTMMHLMSCFGHIILFKLEFQVSEVHLKSK